MAVYYVSDQRYSWDSRVRLYTTSSSSLQYYCLLCIYTLLPLLLHKYLLEYYLLQYLVPFYRFDQIEIVTQQKTPVIINRVRVKKLKEKSHLHNQQK